MVVDDHPVLRAGVVAIVKANPRLTVVAEAGNGLEAIDGFRKFQPDVTLMDLQMPAMDGTSAIIEIRREWPDARIVVLTTYSGDVQALKALKAGATGYLLKTSIRKNLTEAVFAAFNGHRSIPQFIAESIGAHAVDEPLSAREVEVLQHLADSSRNKLIATRMGLSEGTVKTHMKNILTKLNAGDRTEAIVIALRRGIISLADAPPE